ncbi:uncharacterized protein [Antedon mediterranea]|uniref:uncharacterized protein isoform X2 n=1 Tax=Antedon mediterranea TaxID=105859 RepID=UPI003AF5459E
MLRILREVCPCGSRSFESSQRRGIDEKIPETRHLLTTQQSTSSFQASTPVMATAAISEGSFKHVEPRTPVTPTDLDLSDTHEGPSSPTSPMSDTNRPTSPEGLLSDEEDMEGLDDGRKKKRFRPFKSIRKLFKKKRTSKPEDDLDGVRSKSTGELNLSDLEERMFDPKETSANMMSSRSESSVYVPDQPSIRSEETSKSTEHISKDFAKDLSAMLARRKSPDKAAVAVHTSQDDMEEEPIKKMMQPKEEAVRKTMPSKEKSFDDTDVNDGKLKEPTAARRVKSMSAAMSSHWAEKRTKYTGRVSKSTGDAAAYLDLDVVKTSTNGPLSHSAAKHKMSIKPKTRRATTRGRLSSSQKSEQSSEDPSFNDSSISSNIGDTSVLLDSKDELSTSSLLENQQETSETLPLNKETFSTSDKNADVVKAESFKKEANTEAKQKWTPPPPPSTSPQYIVDPHMIINKSKELQNETRKPVTTTTTTNRETQKENTNPADMNKQKETVTTFKFDKTEKTEARKPVIIVPLKKDDIPPSNNILTPSELVIRNRPVNKTEEPKEVVQMTENKMSDEEEDKQPRKSVRDRILLFQSTASRNNSNNSSPIEVRKVEIEVADKNGNKEMVPFRVNSKDEDNGNASHKVLSNSNVGESSETSSKEQERNQQNRRTVNKLTFKPKTDICIVCNKAVYMNEMSRSEGKIFHKACQKCVECTRTLQVGNVLLVGNKLYCRIHGSQEKMKLLKMRSEVD